MESAVPAAEPEVEIVIAVAEAEPVADSEVVTTENSTAMPPTVAETVVEEPAPLTNETDPAEVATPPPPASFEAAPADAAAEPADQGEAAAAVSANATATDDEEPNILVTGTNAIDLNAIDQTDDESTSKILAWAATLPAFDPHKAEIGQCLGQILDSKSTSVNPTDDAAATDPAAVAQLAEVDVLSRYIHASEIIDAAQWASDPAYTAVKDALLVGPNDSSVQNSKDFVEYVKTEKPDLVQSCQ